MALTVENAPMNVKSTRKLLVTFSACFLCALRAGVVAIDTGLLSPRGLGIFYAGLCLVSFVCLTIAFRRLSRTQPIENPFTAPRERRLAQIRVYKASIALLALCLIGGIVKGASVHPFPLFPMLVGITINLLTTYVLVVALRELQRSVN